MPIYHFARNVQGHDAVIGLLVSPYTFENKHVEVPKATNEKKLALKMANREINYALPNPCSQNQKCQTKDLHYLAIA